MCINVALFCRYIHTIKTKTNENSVVCVHNYKVGATLNYSCVSDLKIATRGSRENLPNHNTNFGDGDPYMLHWSTAAYYPSPLSQHCTPTWVL